MTKIEKSYNGFIDKVSEAERKILNTSLGQKLINKLLKEKLKQNPDMPSKEWDRVKSELMTFLFVEFVKRTPEAMEEISCHVWEELRRS